MPQPNTPIPPPAGMKDPLTTADVATLFNVDTRTVARWNDEGLIAAIRTPGNTRRFPWAQFPPMLAGSCSIGPLLSPGAHAETSAVIRIGAQPARQLAGTPTAGIAADGQASIILGYLPDGRPVTVLARTLDWLDELGEATLKARAAGVVEGDMAETETAAAQ